MAALTACQLLESVDGPGGVIFPPTFASTVKGEKSVYNIDAVGGDFLSADGGTHPRNVCLIDSVGAEANRLEPLFRPDKCDGRYADLVPQVRIRVRCTVPGKERDWTVNLLDAGHRAGDAIVRFTQFGERVFAAFRALGECGDAEPLAKLAPTSLVFGVWDSRGTQEKVPRVFRSVVRATNVVPLTRSAQYNRALRYAEDGLVPEELDKGEGEKNPLSREGFNDNPASGAPGGVVVCGQLRRDMAINLAAVRRLRVPAAADPTDNDPGRTLALRRYILGLSLVAATARSEDRYNLREGCQLRQKPGHKPVWREVMYEGDDIDRPDITEELAAGYARSAAEGFGVGEPVDTDFVPKVADMWLRLDEKQQKKRRLQNPMTRQFADGAEPAEAPTPEAGAVAEEPKKGGRRGKR